MPARRSARAYYIPDQTAAALLWPTLTISTVAAVEPNSATTATPMSSQREAHLLVDESPESPVWERPCLARLPSIQCRLATAAAPIKKPDGVREIIVA